MPVRESIEKTMFFFHKTIKNLKSLFFGRYQKLPKAASFKPFFCARSSIKNHQTDQYYADFCNEWESDLEKAMKRKKNRILVSEEAVRIEEDGCNGSSMKQPVSPGKKKEEGLREEKIKKISHSRKGEDQCSKKKDNGGYALAKKMKELEKMDVGDVEHVLDVEEALHYYSRLKSPVYLDMVDKFFTDMYKEFSVPQASGRINSSKGRLGSIRL